MSRAIILAIVGIAVASAASAQVVALGASGTKGYMLPEAETWPAKLQALLHARGLDVSVSNQGINGDTSDGMRARLESAVPLGTRVVIFDPSGNDSKNERTIVRDRPGNIKAIINRLRERGIVVIFSGTGPTRMQDEPLAASLGASMCGGLYKGVPPEHFEQSPAGRHPDAVGTDIIAAHLLPCVMRALKRSG